MITPQTETNEVHASCSREIAEAFGLDKLPSSLLTIVEEPVDQIVYLEQKYKIEKAASSDECRQALVDVYLDGGKAVATDGRIMALVPVHAGNDEVRSGYLPTIAIANARKHNKKDSHVSFQISDKEVQTSDYIKFPKPDFQYPNYKQVLPSKDEEVKMTISLDVKLLLRLAEAIGATEGKQAIVKIEVFNPNSAMRVTTKNSPEAMGIIMPVKVR